MAKLNAYVGFDGKCREALTFYQACLGGELTFVTTADYPATECASGLGKDSIMHSCLIAPQGTLMGTDMTGPEGFLKGKDFSLMLDCSSDEEINSLFAKLSDGGSVTQPLGPAFWGGTFGFLTDKFGIGWMFNYVPAA